MRTVLYILLSTLLPAMLACKDKPAAAKLVESANDTSAHPSAATPHLNTSHVSKGSLSFKVNGQAYEADPSHAKCWSTSNIPLIMCMAKGKDLTVSLEFGSNSGKGVFRIESDKQGKVGFTIADKFYWVKLKGDYLSVTITDTKTVQYSTVMMLSGTFEGQLEDKDGNKVQITDGQFTTESL